MREAKDIVTVCRCKDCKFYHKRYMPSTGVCFGTFCGLTKHARNKDDFCSRAERKKVEE